MKKFYLFLVVFVILGTYHNRVYNTIEPYNATPVEITKAPDGISGEISDSEYKTERQQEAAKAARTRTTYNNPKSGLAIESYKEYVKMNHSEKEAKCYFDLIDKESDWNPNAKNPRSTAYGIGQFIDKTWDSVPQSKTNNPYDQLDAMFHYIEERYGNACNAWSFWQRKGYY